MHTPLYITYERIKTGLDKENRAYIAVYPDIYGRQDISVKDVREKLRPHGWNSWIQDRVINKLIDASDGVPHIFLQFRNLKLNGRHLVEKVVSGPNGLLVPLQPIAEAVRADLVYDSDSGLVKAGPKSYPAVRIDQKLYAAPESINALFSGSQKYDQANQTLEAEVLTLTLNNKAVAGEYPYLSEVPLLPVLTVASLTEQKVFWDEKTATLTVSGKPVPAQVIGGKPYLPINKVYEFFAAYVYWDEAARNIDLTYPFREPIGD
jgi:L,D-transpeptidase ErfK/SrfK